MLAVFISLNVNNPVPYPAFRGRVFLITSREASDSADCGPRWVPIRPHVKKRKMTFGICEATSVLNCQPIRMWRHHIEFIEPEGGGGADGNAAQHDEERQGYEQLDPDYNEPRPGKSHLSLDPISCPESVTFDDSLHKFARVASCSSNNVIGNGEDNSRIYTVPAPRICSDCSAPISLDSRRLFEEGVLRSTHGPVRMRVETFQCSDAECNSFVYAEGRDRHIVFNSFFTAATHAFMRLEIQAVITCGTTITSRIQTYLRNRTEDRYSGLVPSERTRRTLG